VRRLCFRSIDRRRSPRCAHNYSTGVAEIRTRRTCRKLLLSSLITSPEKSGGADDETTTANGDDDNATSRIEKHCTDTTTRRARALDADPEQLRRRLFCAHCRSIVFAIIVRVIKKSSSDGHERPGRNSFVFTYLFGGFGLAFSRFLHFYSGR